MVLKIRKKFDKWSILKIEIFIFKMLNWIDILNMNNLFVLIVWIIYVVNKCKKGVEVFFLI